jgi:hypothetical protein
MKKLIFIFIVSFSLCNLMGQNNELESLNNELFHMSWVFDPGEYYTINDDINIYSIPNANGNIIGNLVIHDKIMVIEDVHNEQNIDGIRSCWYKIQFEEIIGYIWGGNIAVKTFVFDIDNNGINEYFQYRLAWVAANCHYRADRDVIIYYNNKKVSSEVFINDEEEPFNYSYNWFNCIFNNNKVIIELTLAGPNYTVHYIFEMDGNGNILLKDIRKKGELFKDGEWIIYE